MNDNLWQVLNTFCFSGKNQNFSIVAMLLVVRISELLLMCASAKFRGDLPNGIKVEMHTHLVNFISYSL